MAGKDALGTGEWYFSRGSDDLFLFLVLSPIPAYPGGHKILLLTAGTKFPALTIP